MKQTLLTILLSTSSLHDVAQALTSNAKEAPQLLTDICETAQGRTSTCEVELDVPASCITSSGDTSDCPVVFFFHGAGGSNNWFAKTSGVHEANVIGVYPQGENGWNTGPKESNVCEWDDFACTEDPDEGAFIASIITKLKELGANGNIYLNGNSNGAALSMRLASNAGADLPIRGIITKVTQLLAAPPRSGPGVLNYNQPEAGGQRVSILNIMGTEDLVIPYEGGVSSVFGQDANFELMAALESMTAWALHNDCSEDAPEESANIVYSNDADSNGEATFYSYQGCPEGVVVEHYALHGAGHSFGANAALDGVKIDYELAFQFINRLEGTELPVTPSPVTSPGGGNSCGDDPAWHGKFNADHTCDYVAESPGSRCTWENADGVLAEDACKVACDKCGGGGSHPITTSSPTASPIEDLQCEDDPLWHGKINTAHGCDYVALDPLVRCNFVSEDGVKAENACEKACGENCIL